MHWKKGQSESSGERDVDVKGDMLETGLEPGVYELSIVDGSRYLTKAKRITVAKNQETKVSFTIDSNLIEIDR